MKTSARTGLALAAAGVATSGITMLSGGAAQAATGGGGHSAPPVCTYDVVKAPSGLHVRDEPNTHSHIAGKLRNGQRIKADCDNKPKGWAKLRGGVKPQFIGKWVSRAYLEHVRPKGGVGTGGGGTAAETSSTALAATGIGLGTIVLGGGVAIASRRRRAEGQS